MPAPQMIETPTMRRSAMLAKLLEEQRQPVEIKGGYGELAARLLGQGITQFGANRAERAVRDERAARTADQASAYALQLSGLSGEPPPSAAASTPTPMPTTVPMPSTPALTGPTAPVGEVMGSNLPNVGQPIPVANVPPPTPVAPVEATPQPTLENALLFGQVPAQQGPTAAPQMAAPAAPAAPQNPLAGTPGELAGIQEGLDIFRRTGDPAVGAWVNGEISRIRQRMDAPAAERRIVVDVNGINYLADPTGATPPVRLFGEQGVPEEAQNETFLAGPRNNFGVPAGTLMTRSPEGVVSVVSRQDPGYELGPDGGLQPIRGGPQDPAAGGNRIQNERELRREFGTLTQEYRTVRQAFQKVEASLGQGTGIGDVGGIFGVMKIFDPGSTVREGEAATVQNSGGVPETIRGLYNRVVTGERLTPAQRAEIVAVGRAQFGTYEQGYQSRVTDFTRMANDYGIDPRNIVGGDEAPAPPRTPAGGGGSPPRITTQAQYNELASGEPYIDPNGVRRTKQ
jgi:hypothetical protein